jgi:hypothetical protein
MVLGGLAMMSSTSVSEPGITDISYTAIYGNPFKTLYTGPEDWFPKNLNFTDFQGNTTNYTTLLQ